MDDDSCVMKFIEIVPLTKSTESSEIPDVKHPVQVKVCIFTLLLHFWILEFGLIALEFGLSALVLVVSATG